MAFDLNRRMAELGYEPFDFSVAGDVRKVKVKLKRGTIQDGLCEWLRDGCYKAEPNMYDLFEQVFHTFPYGTPAEIVARICEEYKKGNVKLERRTKKCFRECFGMDI